MSGMILIDMSSLQAMVGSLNSGDINSIIITTSALNRSKIFAILLKLLSLIPPIVYMVRYYVLLKKDKGNGREASDETIMD